MDPVGDDQAPVGGGLQPGQRRRHHVQPARQLAGRLHQRVTVDPDHPDVRADLGQELGRHAPARLPHALVVVGPALPGGPGPQAGGAAATVAVHRHDVEGAPQAAAGGRGQAGVQRVVAAAGEPPDRACAAVRVDAAHRDGVAAVDVLGPGVGHSSSRALVDDREARVPDVAGFLLTHPDRLFPPAAVPPPGEDGEPAACPALPAHVQAAVLGGGDLLVERRAVGVADRFRGAPPAVDEAAGPHPDRATGPAEDQPRNTVGGDGRRGAEQVLGPRDDDGGLLVHVGHQPVAAALLPLQPGDDGGGTAGGDGGAGCVAAVRKGPRGLPHLAGQPRRLLEHRSGLGELGGDLPVALVHPHVPQRIGVQRGDGVGDVDSCVDRRDQAVVEGQHHVEIGPLPLGVLAPVVIGGAAVPVPVRSQRLNTLSTPAVASRRMPWPPPAGPPMRTGWRPPGSHRSRSSAWPRRRTGARSPAAPP